MSRATITTILSLALLNGMRDLRRKTQWPLEQLRVTRKTPIFVQFMSRNIYYCKMKTHKPSVSGKNACAIWKCLTRNYVCLCFLWKPDIFICLLIWRIYLIISWFIRAISACFYPLVAGLCVNCSLNRYLFQCYFCFCWVKETHPPGFYVFPREIALCICCVDYLAFPVHDKRYAPKGKHLLSFSRSVNFVSKFQFL